MALGVPVVATAVGGVPELVGDSGLLVPPGRPDAMAAAVTRVLDDAAWAARSADDGRARIRAHFGVDGVAAQLHRLYADVLEREAV
jgi:glycosyltransferase involved in cell wall biosynthesis